MTTRRELFLGAAALAVAGPPPLLAAGTPAAQARDTLNMLGVPLRAGSLYPGSEDDARAFREVDLVGRLQARGCPAVDAGDVAIPSYLPHHAILSRHGRNAFVDRWRKGERR